MSKPIDDFRRLSSVDMLEGLVRLRIWLRDEAPPEVKEFGLGLVDHMATIQQSHHEYVQEMLATVDELPQGHPGKRLLKAELKNFLFLDPNKQEKCRDRIAKALLSSPPPPDKKRPPKSFSLSGREYAFAADTEPEDFK